MENSKKKTEFKNCPNCGGYIPKHWKRHEKCGWEEGEEVEGDTGTEEETTDEIKEENPKDNVKAEINMELVGSRITVTRKETRQIRDYENNTYSVSISRPVETVTRDEINELQNLAKEVIGEQKKEDGVEDNGGATTPRT